MWKKWAAVNLERYGVGADEWCSISAGFVMVCSVSVLQIDGVLSCDGVVKVG